MNMRSRTFKVLALFCLSGIGSGILTVVLSYIAPVVFWIGVSSILVVFMAASLIICRTAALLRVVSSWKRYAISSIVVAFAYPVAVSIAIESSLLYPAFYRALFSSRFDKRPDVLESEGFYIGLILGSVIGALLMSTALRIITGVWVKKAVLLMVVSGVTTILISSAISALIASSQGYFTGEPFIIFIIGDTLFATLSGYWLVYERPHHA